MPITCNTTDNNTARSEQTCNYTHLAAQDTTRPAGVLSGDWLLMAAEQGLQIIAAGDGGKAGYHVVGNEASA